MRCERGVTLLLEVVFGIALFSIALLFLFGIFPNAQRSMTLSRNVGIAQNLAREYIEIERALPYADVGNVSPAATSPPEVVPITSTVNGVTSTTDFRVTLNVVETIAGKRKVITATVEWDYGTGAGQTRNVTLETYKVSYPTFIP